MPSNIDKLDYSPRTAHVARRPSRDSGEAAGPSSERGSLAGMFFERVAEGIQDRDRRLFGRQVTRYLSFAVAIVAWYSPPSSLPAEYAGVC